jgi:ribose transport system substrate-binding protein
MNSPSLLRAPFLAALALGGALLAAPLSAATRVGVLLKGDTAFWHAVAAGCRDAAGPAGAEVVVRAPASETDIAGQVKLLEELAREDIQALVIAPCSSTALSAPVLAVAARGEKVVVIDSPLDVDVPAYLATNHTDAGDAAGRLLASLVADGDEVAILRHNRTGGATLLRESSAFSALQALHEGLVVRRDVYSGMASGQEVAQARVLLQKYPALKGVLASSTPGTMAMLIALEESGRAGAVKFVGFGFNLNPIVAAALERGTMHGWIAQLPNEIGARGLRTALALVNHQPVPEVSFCDFRVITKANLHDPAVQALLPKKQE